MNYLKELVNLEELNITDCRLGNTGIILLSSIIKKFPKLKKLDISSILSTPINSRFDDNIRRNICYYNGSK